MNRRVAFRYAAALMGLAEERNAQDKIAEDFHAFMDTLHGSHELKAVLISPVISPERKLHVLQELFAKQCDQITMGFMSLIVLKGRAEFLIATAEEYLAMLDARRNIERATVSSASPLTAADQSELERKLAAITGKTIVATYDVKPELRGGFVARIGDRLIDASLAHQLDVLREQFRQGGAQAILN